MDNALRYVMRETENIAWLSNAGRVLEAKRDEWAREDAELIGADLLGADVFDDHEIKEQTQ
jgi:hypothetical protein